MSDTLTIIRYLRSLVNIAVPDDTLLGICLKRGVDPEGDFTEYEEKDCELAAADMYTFLSTSPLTSGKVSDSDADWSHSEGGQTLSASQLAYYRSLANAIYSKYGEPLVSAKSGQWGMTGYGFGRGKSRGKGY